MKILFVSESYYPYQSGVPMVVKYLAEGLAVDNEVTVATSISSSVLKNSSSAGKTAAAYLRLCEAACSSASPPTTLWRQRTAGRWRSYRTPISGISSRTTPPSVWAYSPIKSTCSLRTAVKALLSGGTIHEICRREKIKYMGCNGTGNPGPVPSLRGLPPGAGAL